MFKGFFFVVACTLVAPSVLAQDPQALVNALIQRQMQQDEVRKQNEMMRLQMERLDLEQELRFRRSSDAEIEEELYHYCLSNGEPPCQQNPPNALLQEASRRGLINYKASPRRPALDCVTMGDGLGGGITDCQ